MADACMKPGDLVKTAGGVYRSSLYIDRYDTDRLVGEPINCYHDSVAIYLAALGFYRYILAPRYVGWRRDTSLKKVR